MMQQKREEIIEYKERMNAETEPQNHCNFTAQRTHRSTKINFKRGTEEGFKIITGQVDKFKKNKKEIFGKQKNVEK